MKSRHLTKKEWMLFFLEEGDSKKEQLRHIETCELCKKRMASEERVYKLLLDIRTAEAPEHLLSRCRLFLSRSLEGTRLLPVEREFPRIVTRPILQTAFALLILAGGFLLGRFVPGRGMDTVFFESAPLEDFEVTPVSDSPGQVEIRYRSVQEKHIVGGQDTQEIVEFLCHGLVHDPRDNVRLKALAILEGSLDRHSVRSALIRAVEKDPNPGIRLKAIKMLRTVEPDKALRRLFVLALLQDENSGVRREALHGLMEMNDPELDPVLEQIASEDPYTRAMVLRKRSELDADRI